MCAQLAGKKHCAGYCCVNAPWSIACTACFFELLDLSAHADAPASARVLFGLPEPSLIHFTNTGALADSTGVADSKDDADDEEEEDDDDDAADEEETPEPYEGEVVRGKNGWVAIADVNEFVYYFNEFTGATQWDKPEGFNGMLS